MHTDRLRTNVATPVGGISAVGALTGMLSAMSPFGRRAQGNYIRLPLNAACA